MLYGLFREDIRPCTAGYTEMENPRAAQKLLTGLKLFQVSRRDNALYCSPDLLTFSVVRPYEIPLEWLGDMDWQAELERYREAAGTDLTKLFRAEGDQFPVAQARSIGIAEDKALPTNPAPAPLFVKGRNPLILPHLHRLPHYDLCI